MNLKDIGLSTSAFAYNMGAAGKNTERKNPAPWTIEEFVDFAFKLGLGGIEAPLMRFIPDLDPSRIKKLKEKLQSRQMFFIMDAELPLDKEEIVKLIPYAKDLGSPIIRIKSSSILECNRAKLGKPWREHVSGCIEVLKEIKPTLQKVGLRIAIENHQDLDSNDLLRIVDEVGTDVLGVTFDIGNAFSVCEDPMDFATKLGSRIINVHIKDYKIYETQSGSLLVRCPIGSGAVDFESVLPALAGASPDAKMVIELGALEGREIKWRQDGFWQEIEPRTEAENAAFSRRLKYEKAGQAKTPWEREAPGLDVADFEVKELEESLIYLKTL
ncbi:MAG: sugar phosphate isomerase/epimerase [Candidatus Zambryskibacteria bacterium]|nr:sugar phosphate isomerase/epimerase [Candidatus Zambryskibacteria bacterium]